MTQSLPRSAPRPYVDEFVIDTLCGKLIIVVRSDAGEERELDTKCEKLARNVMVISAQSPFQYLTYIGLRYYRNLGSAFSRVKIDFPVIDLTQSADTAVPSFNEVKLIVMVWY